MIVVVTKKLKDQLLELDGDEYWERLADVAQCSPEWLKEQVGGSIASVRYKVTKTKEYGEVKL
jgi:hypothetical protein